MIVLIYTGDFLVARGMSDTIKAQHVFIEFFDLEEELCLDESRWVNEFEKLANEYGMAVIAKNSHVFLPPRKRGMTAYLLLDSSHCSVHTYSDLGLAAVDVFTCATPDLQPGVARLMRRLGILDKNVSSIKSIERFSK